MSLIGISFIEYITIGSQFNLILSFDALSDSAYCENIVNIHVYLFKSAEMCDST